MSTAYLTVTLSPVEPSRVGAPSISLLTIKNTGSASALCPSFSSDSPAFSVLSALPLLVPAGKSVYAAVLFNPTTVGVFTGQLSVISNATSSPQSVALSGTGLVAQEPTPMSPVATPVATKMTPTAQAPTPMVPVIAPTTPTLTTVTPTPVPTAPPTPFTPAPPPTPQPTPTPPQTPVILWPTPASVTFGTVLGATQLNASSTVAGTFAYSPAAGTIPTAGAAVITVTFTPTNTSYFTTATKTVTLTVNKATPAVNWATPAAITSGTTLSVAQLDATSTIPGTFVYTPALGTTPAVGTTTLSVTLTPADSTNYTTATKTVSLVVNTAPVVLTSDIYGGSIGLLPPQGVTTHFTTKKINNRWYLLTPLGNAFWLKGVFNVNASDNVADTQGVMLYGTACTLASPPSPAHPCSVVDQKYGDAGPTWGPATVQRLAGFGFNTTAEYSSAYVQPTSTNSDWTTTDQSNPQKMPFTGLVWPSHYARNANSYAGAVKDIVGPLNPAVYSGTNHPMLDVFDPNFSKWLLGDLADYQQAEYNWIHSPHSNYLLGINVDDTDELFGFGAGVDFEGLNNGSPVTGMAHAHLGWVVLCTPPTQATGTDANGNSISYSISTVYSKSEFSTFMSDLYNGSISALNTAWKSSYTTFGSSGGWGVGTGLLDEDGTHSWVSTDPYGLVGGTAIMTANLNAFLLHFAQTYFSTIKSAMTTTAPGVLYLGPTNLGGWGAPPRAQILQAAGPYVDVLAISSIPTGCLSCTDDQARIEFVLSNAGDKPLINWEGFMAHPDSSMSAQPPALTSYPQYTTQALRGAAFKTMVAANVAAKSAVTGTYPIVGYKWWQYYDDRGEEANWGLLTRRDNAYDGVQATKANGEAGNYGNFTGPVTEANQGVYPSLV